MKLKKTTIKLVIIGLGAVLLAACEPQYFGVPKSQWDTLTPQQKQAVIDGYNQQQKIREQNAPVEDAINAANQRWYFHHHHHHYYPPHPPVPPPLPPRPYPHHHHHHYFHPHQPVFGKPLMSKAPVKAKVAKKAQAPAKKNPLIMGKPVAEKM